MTRGWWAVLTVLLVAGCAAPGPAPRPTVPPTARATIAAAAGRSPQASIAAVPARPTGHQAFTAIPTDVGRLLVTRLVGVSSGVTLRVWVWLPPQYDRPAFAHTDFPALMLYPGGTGAGYNTWAGRLYGAREAVAAGAVAGRVSPFVFVMPEMQPSRDQDTECADLPGHPRMGTFLSVDVRRMVEGSFRVLHDRSGWGAAGASSGAYCATRLVFNHSDQYAAVVSLAGYFTIETALSGATGAVVRSQDPAALAVSAPPPVSVLVWTGNGNAPDLRDARRFLALIRPPTRAELRVLPGGRHLTRDFARMIPGSLAYLTEHLAGPTPVGVA